VSRALTRLIVALIVLFVLAIAADRVGAVLAARSVADGLTTSQGLSRPASVSFPDVPFLPQAVRGRYDTVEVTLEGLKLPDGLVVDRVDATLHGVSAPAGPLLRGQLEELPVDSGEAVAFVSFDALEAAARGRLGSVVSGLNLGQATVPGRVTISATARPALGGLTLRGQAQLSVSRGVVGVKLLPETLAGVPVGLRSQVAGLLDLTALAPALPFGFRASGVTVEPSGLRLTASGTKLAVPA
jgi:hypothetical protein